MLLKEAIFCARFACSKGKAEAIPLRGWDVVSAQFWPVVAQPRVTLQQRPVEQPAVAVVACGWQPSRVALGVQESGLPRLNY